MRWYHGIGALGVILIGIGHALGLFWAPPEAMMGDVGRILYAHVPTAWNCLVGFLIAFVAACGTLWTGKRGWEATMVAAVEVGMLYNALLLIQGSLWGGATWGVYWTWDPRLTTTAIMLMLFAGVLVLRALVHRADRRTTISAIATIVAFVDVPIVYFAADKWDGLHQEFSSPETVSDPMIIPLRLGAFGMLFLGLGFIGKRRDLVLAELDDEEAAPDLPEVPEPVELEARS